MSQSVALVGLRMMSVVPTQITPLMAAAAGGHVPIIAELARRGADALIKDEVSIRS